MEVELCVINIAAKTFVDSRIKQLYDELEEELRLLSDICPNAFESSDMSYLQGEIRRLNSELSQVRADYILYVSNRKKELENRISSLKEADKQYHVEAESENASE